MWNKETKVFTQCHVIISSLRLKSFCTIWKYKNKSISYRKRHVRKWIVRSPRVFSWFGWRQLFILLSVKKYQHRLLCVQYKRINGYEIKKEALMTNFFDRCHYQVISFLWFSSLCHFIYFYANVFKQIVGGKMKKFLLLPNCYWWTLRISNNDYSCIESHDYKWFDEIWWHAW